MKSLFKKYKVILWRVVLGFLVIAASGLLLWFESASCAKQRDRELKETVELYDQQLIAKDFQIDSLQKNAQAMKAEVNWARDRVAKRETLVDELRNENKELQALLDSRIPRDIVE